MKLRPLVLAAAAALTLVTGGAARADSGRFQLHLDVGAGAPIAGTARARQDAESAAGGVAWLSADWQLAPPIAIELIAGGGGFGRRFPTSDRTGTSYGTFAAGVRLRFLDDDAGYRGEEGGNLPSNLWVSAHAGFHRFDGAQFGIDAAAGYEISVRRPLQLGLFVRTAFLFGGDDSRAPDLLLVGGVSLSLELLETEGEADTDGDGLSDAREAELGTDPTNDDTDGDGLPDGVEADTDTSPLERDTDGDGLNDGREDANRNGVLDPGETDPRRSDTDGGGMPDPDEVRDPSQDPRYAEDDDTDRDGVPNHLDACAGTEEGAEVDGAGCPPLGDRLTLEGVQFRSGSAEILPESEAVLQRTLETLRRVPDVRLEIAGYTDDRGGARANRRLSQRRARAVLRWFVEHGLDGARFEARGYGEADPVDTNDTPEGRARNRRIELRRLDGE